MNKKTKMTYLILGLGIGIIFASTLYSFYPRVEYRDLTDDIIIEKAKELGMVSLKERIEFENTEEKSEDNTREIEENTVQNIAENAIDDTSEVELEVETIEEKEIIVESGSSLTRVARKLYNENLIDDIDKFILFVKDKKLDKKIVTGRYKIESNSSYDEIIEILTRRPN